MLSRICLSIRQFKCSGHTLIDIHYLPFALPGNLNIREQPDEGGGQYVQQRIPLPVGRQRARHQSREPGGLDQTLLGTR